MSRRIAILGPQRLRPNLDRALEALEIEGPLAAVTAGWQELEGEAEDLGAHVERKVVTLELYRRAEDVFARDPEFFDAYRERQDRLRALREIYGRRLHHALEAARELFALPVDSDLLVVERSHAVDAVCELDRHHLDEVDEIHRAFARRWRPERRASVAQHRRELSDLLAGTAALAIAGGHVAILLNRMRLFGLLNLAGDKPLVAWSAGAMVLAERIVLFHDSPPQGAGNAEVLESGFDRLAGLLPFPHARRRLRLEDPVRVALLARRLAPARCLALDEGDGLIYDGSWRTLAPVRRLGEDGSIDRVEGELE